ncbi:MAG: antibiotic biosynthesis monooxygenase [Deltaproteobacteria bacterium]|nr:antibiotic biosynthesis monooxygenase [Deltaproteobacteria bacterium]
MFSKNIRVIAHFKAKPEKIDALRSFLLKFIAPTLLEKGCIEYELHQNTDEPRDFTFIEAWQSHESLDQHLKSPHIQSALPLIGDLVSESPDIRRYVKCEEV